MSTPIEKLVSFQCIIILLHYTRCSIHALHAHDQHPTNKKQQQCRKWWHYEFLEIGFECIFKCLIHLLSNRQVQSRDDANAHFIVIIISLIIPKILMQKGNQHYNYMLIQPMSYGLKQHNQPMTINILAHYFSNSICDGGVVCSFIDKMV